MDFGKLINLALMVMVVIVTILFFVPAMSTLYAQLFKSDLDSLKISDKLHIENNFNEIVNNLDSCMKINDSNCYCEGLPDFPDGTLPKESEIIIERYANGTRFILRYNEKNARTRNTSINFSAFYHADVAGIGGKWEEDSDIAKMLQTENRTTLNFKLMRIAYTGIKALSKKEEAYYPYFERKGILSGGNIPLASGFIYKSLNKTGFVTITPTLSGMRDTSLEGADAQKAALGKITPCAPNKAEAKEELRKLVSVLKSQKEGVYKVNLPDDYEILLGGKILFLEYNKKKIEENSLDNCICNNCTFSYSIERTKSFNITLANQIPCVKN